MERKIKKNAAELKPLKGVVEAPSAVAIAVAAQSKLDTTGYLPSLQNKFLNDLADYNTNTKRDTSTRINKKTQEIITTQGDLSLAVSVERPDIKWAVSTSMLWDYILAIFTQRGKPKQFTFLLNDYMEARGLKDPKSARDQIKIDLDVISAHRVSYDDHKGYRFGFVNLVSHATYDLGVIDIEYDSKFLNALTKLSFIYFPELLWKININRNPHSYYLLRTLTLHKRRNQFHKNANTISVQTLLEECPEMPSYDDVKKTDRAFDKRIISPFERDLDALDEVLSWEYCHANGKPLTDEELDHMRYDLFKELLIRVHWKKKFPGEDERLIKHEQSKALAEARNALTIEKGEKAKARIATRAKTSKKKAAADKEKAETKESTNDKTA